MVSMYRTISAFKIELRFKKLIYIYWHYLYSKFAHWNSYDSDDDKMDLDALTIILGRQVKWNHHNSMCIM